MLQGGMTTGHMWFLGRLQNNEIRILDLLVGLSAYGVGIDLTMPFITNTSLFM